MNTIAMQKIDKPFLRGRVHEAAAFFSLGACLMLLDLCQNIPQFLATLVYSLSLVGLFTCSAIYHRVQWKEKARAIMRRLDHAAIFLLIAGTMTPLFFMTLSPESSQKAIALIWIVASIGVIQSVFWIKAPKWLAAVLYVAAGWLGFPYLSEMSLVIGRGGVALVLTGGILYTIGALVYAFKRPNPWPKVFGYHEIFHVLVAIAAACHFVMIKLILQS